MNKTALIFGVNGFVGSYLAKELASHEYDVVGSGLREDCRCSSVCEYRLCDLSDAASVSAVMTEFQPDAVVNLAAVSSVGRSWEIPALSMRVNVEGTVNVMEAARLLPKPPRILLVGSSEEYASSNRPLKESDPIDATSPYGISKVAQEQFASLYVNRYGLEVCLTRSFNHTGQGQSSAFVLPSWCRQVADIERSGIPGEIAVGNLDAFRDFSDVRDVVRAYRYILDKGYAGEIYNVGSGRALPLRGLLKTVIGFSSQTIEVCVNESLLRPFDVPYVCCDNSKIREDLGWEPGRKIEETLREMFLAFLYRRNENPAGLYRK